MRPIARQSSRLAASRRARQSSRPPLRVSQQQRTFSTTVSRSEPRSPNGQSDDTSFNGWRESSNKSGNEPPKVEQSLEQENGESKSGGEGRRSGMRRSFRQKRVNEVPKPPPIPKWFLEQNVRLVEEVPGVGFDRDGMQTIRCVDNDTGHTLFAIPFYNRKQSLAVAEGRPRSHETQQRPHEKHIGDEGTFKASASPPGAAEAAGKDGTKIMDQDAVDNDVLKDGTSRLRDVKQAIEDGVGTLEHNFFNQKFQGLKKEVHARTSTASKDTSDTDPGVLAVKDSYMKLTEWNMDPMRWIYLEAEISVQAALSLADSGQRSSSFAADRVDLSLQCPDLKSHDQMDEFVRDLASVTQADVVRLDANDFAELSEEYVGQGNDGPGSFSNLGYDIFDGYEATELGRHSNAFRPQLGESEENDMEEDDEEDEDEQDNSLENTFTRFGNIGAFRKAMMQVPHDLRKALRPQVIGIGEAQLDQPVSIGWTYPKPASIPSSLDLNRDDARLDALLDNLINAPMEKRAIKKPHNLAQNRMSIDFRSASYQDLLRYSRRNQAQWFPETASLMVGHLNQAVAQRNDPTRVPYQLVSETSEPMRSSTSESKEEKRTIVHVRDLRELCNNRLGDSIVKSLVKAVRKRRRNGERIVIIGTTAQDVPGPFRMPGDHFEDFPFRTLTVPPFFDFFQKDDAEFDLRSTPLAQNTLDDPAYGRILEINLRHIQAMMRRLRPDDDIDLSSVNARRHLNMPGMHFLTERVLSMDQVQRLALIAIGWSQSHAKAESVTPTHIVLAAMVTVRSDHILKMWIELKGTQQAQKLQSDFRSSVSKKANSGDMTAEARLEQVRKSCNSHETRLLSGVVNPQNIKTTFGDVHAPAETIEALKTLTSLSLIRPDAFTYGVLANDRLSGLLLYGPPGTGKTLLAKAVAKESRATVVEVSGAQIYEKYVGEGEKMVRAVFSLAKKLSPCVVFIDEADAIFGSRGDSGNRSTHREIINQFLREWDGMDDHGVFMMVASNRPFDLDDAVLRRLPRRLLVDLPVAKDRESILGIHLRNEALDSSVSLTTLAEQTPLYSGSDLKNLSVAAALACVREENELAESKKEDKSFKLPDKRTITSVHFDKALAEISASISEDMSSLTAIRKFDEQYGDRKGRRKKTGYGFGAVDGMVDEDAARVRQSSSSPSQP